MKRKKQKENKRLREQYGPFEVNLLVVTFPFDASFQSINQSSISSFCESITDHTEPIGMKSLELQKRKE
jgi:hypothetical protein